MNMAEEIAELKLVLDVNEIFGPTVQGEGPSTGVRCAFLRLSGCNLTCVWCDTPYTWDWKGQNGTPYSKEAETHPMSVHDVWFQLTGYGVPLYVISGGEPMMQQEALGALIPRLMAGGKQVEVETNGTIKPKIEPTRFNVSPKLTHSGVREKIRFKPETLNAYVGRSIFKFVCQTVKDLDEVMFMAAEADIPDSAIWIMPEGRDPVTLMSHAEAITDEAIARGWNITGRLHVMTWGARRGV
jgi:organic radical activating enzyme